MKRALFVLVLGFASASARAEPPTLSIDAKDLALARSSLVEQLDEPTGLLAIANLPKLGLQKNDVVRAINGEAALRDGPSRAQWEAASIVYLDIVRGGKPLVVRLAVKLSAMESRIERPRFIEDLDYMQHTDTHGMFSQVTSKGDPAGLAVHIAVVGFEQLVEGDIIRKIDGAKIETIDQALAALDAAKDHAQVVYEIDRIGQTFSYTVKLEDPPKEDPALDAMIGKIKKVNDTTYELPRGLLDTLLANPPALAKAARIVPSVKNGKPNGLKLYAIRPSSALASLGLTNGDTVLSVNGEDLTSPDKALEAYRKLKAATSFKLAIERRGSPITLEWRIK